MSRSSSKPYSRDASRPSTDSQWKHDLHNTVRGTLADRLGTTTRKSGSGSNGPGGSLLDRLSGGAGKELLPANSSSKGGKMHADTPSTSTSANAGRELLPSKAARPVRSSRPRGAGRVDPSAHPLLAQSLGALSGDRRGTVARSPPSPPTPAVGGGGVTIMGAAGLTVVRVEHLARGTTADDVKSAFAPTPILSAKIVSGSRDATATVELEIADRASADALIAQYDGVAADGEILKLTVVRPRSPPARGQSGRAGGGGGGGLSSRIEPKARPVPSSGKMYSDQIAEPRPAPQARPAAQPQSQSQRQPSLAARLGRR
ncbi:uncharacterized protein EHS24_007472 [Apiotrichum porosum]|uniref:RRM domain-containing protein n=1 Tax=Apiotrichum porosum TaxID=105984 RepID=A0A427XUI0_9TREE|nr:uncharacterized protein EHS24_007472 [Apiotrichum porosum]RSH82492.1 hypothetical protein EHS24_007472 [Apiotrichum porosum]